jgi:hypothetical protein
LDMKYEEYRFRVVCCVLCVFQFYDETHKKVAKIDKSHWHRY